jgi:hypothetical protein
VESRTATSRRLFVRGGLGARCELKTPDGCTGDGEESRGSNDADEPHAARLHHT